MKKRILVFLLCLSMVFTPVLATACAAKETPVPAPAEQNNDPTQSDQPGKEETSDDPTPDDPTPDDPMPDDPTPEDPTPDDPTPDDPTPDDPTPEDPTPEDPTPEDPTPDDPTPTDQERYQKLGQATQNTVQAVQTAGFESSFSQAWKNAMGQGSVALSVVGNPAAETPQTDLYAKLWAHGTSGALGLLIGKNDAAVWYDLSSNVAFRSEALLGGAYGVNTQALFFLLLQAIPPEVLENEQMAQALSAVVAMLMSGNGLSFDDSDTDAPDADPGDATASFVEDLIAYAEENFEIAESQEQTTSLGKKVAGTRFTLSLSEDDLSMLIDPLYTVLEKAEEIKPMLKTVYPYLLQALESLKKSPFGASVAGVELPADFDDLIKVSPAELTILLDLVKNVLSKVTGDISVFLNDEDLIVRVEAAVRIQEIPITVVLELGDEPGNGSGEFALSVKLPIFGNLVGFSNRKTATGRKIAFEYNGYVIPNANLLSVACEINIPETYGTTAFQLTVMKKGEGGLPETEKTVASFDCREEDGSTIISGFTLVKNDKAEPLPTVQITICENDDTLPETPEYTDISTMTAEEREALWAQIQAGIAALFATEQTPEEDE